jgi:hypothetical protein
MLRVGTRAFSASCRWPGRSPRSAPRQSPVSSMHSARTRARETAARSRRRCMRRSTKDRARSARSRTGGDRRSSARPRWNTRGAPRHRRRAAGNETGGSEPVGAMPTPCPAERSTVHECGPSCVQIVAVCVPDGRSQISRTNGGCSCFERLVPSVNATTSPSRHGIVPPRLDALGCRALRRDLALCTRRRRRGPRPRSR